MRDVELQIPDGGWNLLPAIPIERLETPFALTLTERGLVLGLEIDFRSADYSASSPQRVLIPEEKCNLQLPPNAVQVSGVAELVCFTGLFSNTCRNSVNIIVTAVIRILTEALACVSCSVRCGQQAASVMRGAPRTDAAVSSSRAEYPHAAGRGQQGDGGRIAWNSVGPAHRAHAHHRGAWHGGAASGRRTRSRGKTEEARARAPLSLHRARLSRELIVHLG